MIHPKVMQIVAYGDAFGLPYETRTKQEIVDLGGVQPKIIEPYSHSDFDDFAGMPAGTWSDDTQHALVVAESLRACGEYSLMDIGLRLKREMQRAKGWGKTTKKALARITEHMTDEELRQNGETVGNGCGPLMRSLPLAVFAATQAPHLLEQMAFDSSALTHNNPENIACTVTHHQVLAYLLKNGTDTGKLQDVVYDLAKANEVKYGAQPYLSEAIHSARDADDIARAVYESGKWGAFTSWAVQAVSYEVFARGARKTLLELLVDTVSEGGDADSTGSVVAGMWALTRTDGKLPKDMRKLEGTQRLKSASAFLNSL